MWHGVDELLFALTRFSSAVTYMAQHDTILHQHKNFALGCAQCTYMAHRVLAILLLGYVS